MGVVGRSAGGGRGGRGRARGRGHGKAQDGDLEVNRIDASGFPEIFMANMQAEVEEKLAAEAAMDLDPDASVAQPKSVPGLPKSVPPRASAAMPLYTTPATMRRRRQWSILLRMSRLCTLILAVLHRCHRPARSLGF